MKKHTDILSNSPTILIISLPGRKSRTGGEGRGGGAGGGGETGGGGGGATLG